MVLKWHPWCKIMQLLLSVTLFNCAHCLFATKDFKKKSFSFWKFTRGLQDIRFDKRKQLAGPPFLLLLVCCSVFKVWGFPGSPHFQMPGKLYTIDVQNPQMEPVELRMPRHFDVDTFHPLGINVYTDPTGKNTNYLYVVTQLTQQSEVQTFNAWTFILVSGFLFVTSHKEKAQDELS